MWFLVLKLLKTGFSQAKKHRAAKKQQQQQNDPTSSSSINLDPTTKAGATESANEMLSFNPNTTRNPAKSLLDASLRLLQFVLGLVVIGLYGQHLTLTSDKAAEHGYSPLDARWLYAVITGALASLTALVYMVLMFALRKRTPVVRRTGLLLPVFVWEGVVWVLWLVCFGIFGRLFLAKHHGGGEGAGSDWEEKMWRAVWVDLASWVVWGVSLVWCGVRWWKRGGSWFSFW